MSLTTTTTTTTATTMTTTTTTTTTTKRTMRMKTLKHTFPLIRLSSSFCSRRSCSTIRMIVIRQNLRLRSSCVCSFSGSASFSFSSLFVTCFFFCSFLFVLFLSFFFLCQVPFFRSLASVTVSLLSVGSFLLASS